MPHHKTYMYINFQQKRVCRSDKIFDTNILKKNYKLHKFVTANSIFFFKSIISDMHHRITYIYINFEQNRVSKSVKTERTNIFAKNCKVHKFATTNSIFF